MGWGQEVQIGVGVVGAGGAMAGSWMGQGVGDRSTRWQGRERMAGEQKGQMAVAGDGGAGGPDSREPDGAGAVGQGGPDGWEGGDGRVHEGQMAVAGCSGDGMEQEFKMVGRQGPDQGVRGS